MRHAKRHHNPDLYQPIPFTATLTPNPDNPLSFTIDGLDAVVQPMLLYFGMCGHFRMATVRKGMQEESQNAALRKGFATIDRRSFQHDGDRFRTPDPQLTRRI